jgi:hypothetical protein
MGEYPAIESWCTGAAVLEEIKGNEPVGIGFRTTTILRALPL